jgi:hypothetical protein
MIKLRSLIQGRLNESKTIIDGMQLLYKVEPNTNPTKKGLRIRFVPTNNENIDYEQVSLKLQEILNQGLKQHGLIVDNDTDTPEGSIGFLIRINLFEAMIKRALNKYSKGEDNEQQPEFDETEGEETITPPKTNKEKNPEA